MATSSPAPTAAPTPAPSPTPTPAPSPTSTPKPTAAPKSAVQQPTAPTPAPAPRAEHPPVSDYMTVWVHHKDVAAVNGATGYVQVRKADGAALIAAGHAVDPYKVGVFPYITDAPPPAPTPSPSPAPSPTPAPPAVTTQ